MLEKLSKNQKALIPIIRDKWLSHFFSLKFDEQKTKEFINWIYKVFLGLKKPLILIFHSPMGIQIAANILKNILPNAQVREQVGNQVGEQVGNQVWDQVGNQVWNQVGDQVWNQVWNQVENQVWNQVENQVRNQVWNQVRMQVGNQVWNQVRNQVWNQVRMQVENQVRDQRMKYYSFCQYMNCYDLYWISFYDYFKQINIVLHDKFEKYSHFLKRSGIFMLIALRNIVFISRPPLYIKRNDNNRMHSIKGYAIEFADSYGLHYLNGIYFSPKEFSTFVESKPCAKDILSITNVEKRAEIIKHWGYEYLMNDLELNVISTYKDPNNLTHKLYKCSELPINLLKVIDTSTHKPYILGVPESQTDCLEAIAWTFNLSKEVYKERIES